MEKINISCICPTYGRTEFLEEQIYSFLNQNYLGKKELIIVNDYPLQELVYDHPDIKIINLPKMFNTIGEKMNYCVEQCQYDIIAIWDDDDIALPNHLSNIDQHYVKGTNLLHWGAGVYWNEPNITAITGLGNSGIVYSKEAWSSVGGYPLENAGNDSTFTEKIHAKGNIMYAYPNDKEVSWFYRWGFIPGGRVSKVGCYHQSGQGTDDEIRPNILKRHSIFIEERRQAGFIPTGRIELNPHWSYDYKKQLENFNISKNETKV